MLKSIMTMTIKLVIRSRVLLHHGPAFKYVLIFQPDKLSYQSCASYGYTRQISLLSGKGFSERKDGSVHSVGVFVITPI